MKMPETKSSNVCFKALKADFDTLILNSFTAMRCVVKSNFPIQNRAHSMHYSKFIFLTKIRGIKLVTFDSLDQIF